MITQINIKKYKFLENLNLYNIKPITVFTKSYRSLILEMFTDIQIHFEYGFDTEILADIKFGSDLIKIDTSKKSKNSEVFLYFINDFDIIKKDTFILFSSVLKNGFKFMGFEDISLEKEIGRILKYNIQVFISVDSFKYDKRVKIL